MSVGYDVAQFMKASEAQWPEGEDKKLIEFRISLLDQKYDELVQALQWGDREIIAKEAADFVYYVVGTCEVLDIPFDDVWVAVHESNMSKLDDEGKAIIGPDGKVQKGPNYKGPEKRIEQLVKRA